MHKGTRHVGKQPGHLPQDLPVLRQPQAEVPARKQASQKEILARVEELNRSLQEAVAQERFEDAAKIKKEIVVLEASVAELKSV
jgi:protein-arginine kinase activator protein McsA